MPASHDCIALDDVDEYVPRGQAPDYGEDNDTTTVYSRDDIVDAARALSAVRSSRARPEEVAVQDDKWRVLMPGGDVRKMTLEQLDDAYRLDLIDETTMVSDPETGEWQPLSSAAGLEEDPPGQEVAPVVGNPFLPGASAVRPSSPQASPPDAGVVRRGQALPPAASASASAFPPVAQVNANAFPAVVQASASASQPLASSFPPQTISGTRPAHPVPLNPVAGVASVAPLAISAAPPARTSSKVGFYLLGLAMLVGALCTFQRNGMLHKWSTDLGFEQYYLNVEKQTLGAPGSDTPRGLGVLLGRDVSGERSNPGAAPNAAFAHEALKGGGLPRDVGADGKPAGNLQTATRQDEAKLTAPNTIPKRTATDPQALPKVGAAQPAAHRSQRTPAARAAKPTRDALASSVSERTPREPQQAETKTPAVEPQPQPQVEGKAEAPPKRKAQGNIEAFAAGGLDAAIRNSVRNSKKNKSKKKKSKRKAKVSKKSADAYDPLNASLD